MKQVVVVHGGDTFTTHGEYIAFLKEFVIGSAEYFKKEPDWKATLQRELGDGYDVLLPQMPNKWNARYAEWRLWFEKMFPFLQDKVILVGHSLGASFLAKYLSEETFPKQISATFLVSGPYDRDGERPLAEFSLPPSLSRLEEQGGRIFLYHSSDDPVVPIRELSKYRNALPRAAVRTFTDRGHFNQGSFPEILSDIRNV